jgi:hypothetical protein
LICGGLAGYGLDAGMKKTIVYILSTDYAGSHYVSLVLGSNSRTMHLGEAKRLKKPLSKQGVICTACKDKGPCPVMSGIGPHNLLSIYDLIFSRIDPRKEVLIDASKTIEGWATLFLTNTAYVRKYVHLIRDPRALVRRYLLTNSLNRQLARRWELYKQRQTLGRRIPFSTDLAEVSLYFWLAENRQITQFIRANHLDAMLVTYEDFARDTPRELRRLTEWMGVDYEPAQIEYWNAEHHGTQKTRYDWVKEQKVQYIDLRWKEFLTPETQKRIAGDPLVNSYLAEQGLQLTADGLTLHGGD